VLLYSLVDNVSVWLLTKNFGDHPVYEEDGKVKFERKFQS